MTVKKFFVELWTGRMQVKIENRISDIWSGRIGVGDAVKMMINSASRGKIKQCGGCIKRQQYLNELFSKTKKKNDSGD